MRRSHKILGQMARWRIPHGAWSGCTAFVIGGGDSIRRLGQEKFIAELEGRFPVIAINNAFELIPGADILYWADNYWLQDNWRRLHEHVGWLKVTRQHPALANLNRVDIPRWLGEIKVVGCTLTPYLSDTPDAVGGKNGGHNSIDLAYQHGPKRIVLLGFDMDERAKRNNWHEWHTRPPRASSYTNWIKDLGKLAASAQQRRNVEILNGNPDSAIRCFDFVDPRDITP